MCVFFCTRLFFTLHLYYQNETINNNTKKIKTMTAKEKRQKEDKKLIKRAIDMYIFVYGKEPKSWWCTSADRARTLLDYYKSEFNIIG